MPIFQGFKPQGEGEYLLLATPWDPPAAFLAQLQADYPLMKIEHHKLPSWHTRDGDDPIPEATWKKGTIFLTGSLMPASPDLVPNLKYIQLKSAGSNRIQKTPIYQESKIPICSANGVHGPQIAEWVVMTALTMSHHLPTYLDAMKEEKWLGSEEDGGVEDLVGKRIGILGYGSIGRQIARLSTALGMEVLAYTFRPRATPSSKTDHAYCVPGTGDPDGLLPSSWHHGTTPEELNAFLSLNLDMLVISVPLTPQTTNLISKPQFEILARNKNEKGRGKTFISNIARGAILNSGDLIEALEKGWVSGAALDVTDPEPLPKGHPLWRAKNVLVCPHVSGNSERYNDRVLDLLRENIGRLSRGEKMLNVVERDLGY